MKPVFLILAALVMGTAGGSIGTYAVLAHERGRTEEVIRAHRFELINDNGKTVSFWGADSIGYIELAFGDSQGTNTASSAGQAGSKQNLAALTPSIAIGLEGDSRRPFLSFSGSDRQLRVLLNVDDFERPSLMMSDGKLLGLTLGSERSDTPGIRDKMEHWALSFRPNERARIGASTEQQGSSTYVRGSLFISQDKVPYY